MQWIPLLCYWVTLGIVSECLVRVCDLGYDSGGVSTLWKSPPPWETIIAHASAEFPRGPFYALEPSMLPKELTIVQAEATFDYSPPSTAEYASCIHIKVCARRLFP